MTGNSGIPSSSFRRSRTSRRDLLKLLTGTAAAAAVPTQLHAEPQKALPRPRGLKDEPQAIVDWDVPAGYDTSNAVIHGAGSFSAGRLAYSVSTRLIVKEIQRGETVYSQTSMSLGTPLIINEMLYTNTLFFLHGYDLTKPDVKHPTWDRWTGMDQSGMLAVGERLVYSELSDANTCRIVLYDVTRDMVIWSCDTKRSDTRAAQPLLAGNKILVRLESAVAAVDFATGALDWVISADLQFAVGGEQPGLDSDERYVYFTERTNSNYLIHAVDLQTGSMVWTWSNGAPLGNPVVSQGKVYIADNAGNLHAFVAGPGQDRSPALAFPSVRLTPGIASNRMFTEDGILYAFGQSGVWAVDLASEGQKSVSWGDGSAVVPLGVENGVVYVGHSAAQKLAAVDMADQLHQFACESQLMADDYIDSGSAAGVQPSSTWFRTQVKLLDSTYAPRSGKSVRISMNDPVAEVAVIQSAGKTYTLTPDAPIWLVTNAAGELSLAVKANDLSCPALKLWGNFMDANEAMVIYPDHDTAASLSRVQGSDLEAATAYDGTKMLPANYGGSADLADGLRRMLGNVPAAVSLFAAPRGGAGDPADKYMAYPETTTNLLYQSVSQVTSRHYTAPVDSSWTLEIQSNGSFSLTEGAALLSIPAAGSVITDIRHLAASVVHGAESVAKIVWTAVSNTVSTVIETAKNVYNIVITAVEHAMTVVAATLKSVIGDLKKAWEWLSYIFNWKDILQTKELLKGAVNEWFDMMVNGSTSVLNGVAEATEQTISRAEQSIKDGVDSVVQALGANTARSNQVNNNNPAAFAEKAGLKWFSAMRWITSKLEDGLPGSSSSLSATPALNQFVVTMDGLFVDGLNKMSQDPRLKQLPADFAAFLTAFGKLLVSPQFAIKNVAGAFVETVGDVSVLLLEALNVIIHELISAIPTMFAAIRDLLNAPVAIPVISALWKAISKDTLTGLDVVCLMIAVPATIIQKLDGSLQSASGGTLFGNSVYWFLASEILALVTAIQDGLGTEQSTAVNIAATGLNAVVTASLSPTNWESIGANTGWLIRSLLLVLGSSIMIYRIVKPKGPDGAAPPVPLLIAVGGTANLVIAIDKYKTLASPDTAALKTLLASIFSAVPQIAKPMKTAGSMTTETLALAVIDVAFMETALGLQVSLMKNQI